MTARPRKCRASSRRSRSTTRPADDLRLGGGGGQYLCQRQEGGRGAEDHLRRRAERQAVERVAARRGQAAAGARRFRAVLRQGRRYGGGLRHGGESAGGGIHHQHQHPCAAGADERHRGVQGRHLAHLFRQPVRDALRRDRGGRRRGRSQVRRDAPDVAGRRLRPASRCRHDGAGGAGGEGRRQAGQGDLLARKRHDHGFLASADLPEGQGGSRRRRQAGRAEP